MQASVRSTWLAVGPGRDSLLLSSRNNTPALPAPLALLWSSDLVVFSSHCSLTSIQSHLTLDDCLWSLACQHISLGNKANCPLGLNVFLEFLHSLARASFFICLDHLLWLLTSRRVCRMKPNIINLLTYMHNVPLVFWLSLVCFLVQKCHMIVPGTPGCLMPIMKQWKPGDSVLFCTQAMTYTLTDFFLLWDTKQPN